MKYSIRLLCSALLLVTISSSAQTDTTYIDRDWKQTQKANATYYRTAKKLPDNSYEVDDHYISGQIQMVGHYSTLVPFDVDSESNPAKNGLFTFYDKGSTTKTGEGKIEKGLHEGKWQDFYVNTTRVKSEYYLEHNVKEGKAFEFDSLTGKKYLDGQYHKGEKAGKWTVYYHPSGKLKMEVIYDHNPGSCKVYYETGGLSATGLYSTNATQEGEWKYYDTTGFLAGIYQYKNDTLEGTYTIYKTISRDKLGNKNLQVIDGPDKRLVSSLKERGQMSNGKLTDTIKFFDPSTGELTGIEQFKYGLKNGIYIDYEHKRVKDIGYYEADLKSGKCIDYFSNTDQIFVEVNYQNGKREGLALEYYPSGQKKYEANFKNGHKDGTLKTFYHNNALMSNETYEMGTLKGPAVYYDSISDKITSEGAYSDGKKNGEWKYYNSKGLLETIKNHTDGLLHGAWTRYNTSTGKKEAEGSFSYDRKDGLLKYYFAESDSISSMETYKDGILDGYSKKYYRPGKIKQEGNFEDGVRLGAWKYYYTNGKIYHLEYLFNKGHNNTVTGYDSITGKKTHEVHFVDNKEQGEYRYYQRGTDSIIAIENFDAGKLQGHAIYYYAPGRIKREGNYVLNKMSGEWNYYYYDGSKKSRENYAAGTLTGEAEYYDSLTKYPTKKGNYLDKILTGEWTYYYPNSNKVAVIKHYRNDTLDGATIVLDTMGKTLCEGQYHNNEKTGEWHVYYGGSDTKKVWLSVTFSKDIFDGALDIYYPNGKKMTSQTYVKGSKSSEHYFDEAGKPLQEPDLKLRLVLEKRLKEIEKYTSAYPELGL